MYELERKKKEELMDADLQSNKEKTLMLPHSNLDAPLATLAYSNLTIAKKSGDGKIEIFEYKLDVECSKFDVHEFIMNRSKREDEIEKLKSQSNYSGSYYLNNWLSDINIKIESDNQFGKLSLLIFSLDFSEARKQLEKMPKTLNTPYLNKILNGYEMMMKNIKAFESLEGSFLRKNEFIKQNFEQQKEHINFFLNLNVNSFKNLENEIEMKKCILNNLAYITNFVSKLLSSSSLKMNCYEIIIFQFLRNRADETNQNIFLKLLTELKEIYLDDRLKFALILLNNEQRQILYTNLDKKLCQWPDLKNLVYFKPSKIGSIKQIFTNYLDNFGQIRIVAYLSLDYNSEELIKYINLYQERLQMSNQSTKMLEFFHDKFTRFEESIASKLNSIGEDSQRQSYLSYCAKDSKSLESEQTRQNHRTCFICYDSSNDNREGQFYIECQKCKHGGHFQHLKKWFQESRYCPKDDCSCLCN